MRKILHVITTLSSGGAEAMLYKLLTGSSKHGIFEHSAVSLTGMGVYGPLLQEAGIRVDCLHMDRGIKSLYGFIKLCGIIKKNRPDIIQTWLYHSDLIGFLAGRLCGRHKIVWNLRCSNMDFNNYSFITRIIFAFLKKVSHFPDAVTVNSNAGRMFHANAGYRPKLWKVIYNGFDTDWFRPDEKKRAKFKALHNIDESTLIIGMVARYDAMKDHETFFKAAGRIACPDVSFILVGRGMDKTNTEVKGLIKKNGLTGRVYLLGERADICDILPAFNISALSSAYGEGFPNVLGEAMSCAVPCVATDVGDSAMIIGDTGSVVPVKNPGALAGAWLDMLSMSAEERDRLGFAARERIIENFPVAKAVENYEKLYPGIVKLN